VEGSGALSQPPARWTALSLVQRSQRSNQRDRINTGLGMSESKPADFA
jgi:hypothetical protein